MYRRGTSTNLPRGRGVQIFCSGPEHPDHLVPDDPGVVMGPEPACALAADPDSRDEREHDEPHTGGEARRLQQEKQRNGEQRAPGAGAQGQQTEAETERDPVNRIPR